MHCAGVLTGCLSDNNSSVPLTPPSNHQLYITGL